MRSAKRARGNPRKFRKLPKLPKLAEKLPKICGDFRLRAFPCGTPLARGMFGMVAAACSAQQRSESKKKEQQARARALTQRWMATPTGVVAQRRGAMVLGSMPLIDGPRPQRHGSSCAISSCGAPQCAGLKGRAGSATGTKERTQGGLRSACNGDQGAHGDPQSAPRVQTGELLSIESATSAKVSAA